MAADGLAHSGRENGAQSRSRQDKGGDRALDEDVAEYGAQHAAHSDRRDGVGQTIEPTAGALMMLGKRPHALGASSHMT
jgi:hypothetical protein